MKTRRRYVAVCVHHLPLEVLGFPEGEAGPRAVREERRGRNVVACVDDAARAAGVRPGMTEAEARAGCARLCLRDRDPGLELDRLQQAAERLFAYGPEVEVAPPGTLFVEVGAGASALRHRFGLRGEAELLERIVADLDAMGHRATAGIADDPDSARTFAEHLATERARRLRRSSDRGPEVARTAVVPPGRSRAELGRLPLETIAWTDRREDPEGSLRSRLAEVVASARGLGLSTVADLAAMPPAELGSRFGEAGALLAARARGERNRPLRGFIPPEQLEERFELDQVTEELEPVLFGLRRLLHRLSMRLEARQLAAGRLVLEWWVEPGLDRRLDLDAPRARDSKRTERMELQLARPTRSAETLFAVARERVGGALPGAVLALRVIAERAEVDRGTQLDLFSRRPRRAEAFGELVGRLSAALGDRAVFGAALEDTHRPEKGWSRQPFSVDRALAPDPPPKRAKAAARGPVLVADQRGEGRALPEVGPQLSVTGPSAGASEVAGPVAAEAAPEPGATLGPWPKPCPRRPEDEPPPPLPPRPLELLDPPEPARLEEGGAVLRWRGRRFDIERRSNPEQLDCEWWRPGRKLVRDYLRLDTAGGAALWVFEDPRGQIFVHGLFD